MASNCCKFQKAPPGRLLWRPRRSRKKHSSSIAFLSFFKSVSVRDAMASAGDVPGATAGSTGDATAAATSCTARPQYRRQHPSVSVPPQVSQRVLHNCLNSSAGFYSSSTFCRRSLPSGSSTTFMIDEAELEAVSSAGPTGPAGVGHHSRKNAPNPFLSFRSAVSKPRAGSVVADASLLGYLSVEAWSSTSQLLDSLDFAARNIVGSGCISVQAEERESLLRTSCLTHLQSSAA